MDSGANSVASSPRSDHPATEFQARMRFMCSSGGKILPRPHDNQLRYVGGETRIVAVNRNTTFSSLISKLSKLSGIANVTVKYQLPNEDLDALITVTTDEDVENMMEEYDRLALNQNPRSARLRLFLFHKGEELSFSRTSSISSLLDGSANRGQWFVDALNAGGSGLERGRSEASSILSEVPDYLFGLDHSEEGHARDTKLIKPRSAALNDNVSASDPGSPAPVVNSPYGSTSSVSGVAVMPNLPPVRTKPDNPVQIQTHETDQAGLVEPVIAQTGGYPGQTMWRYPTPVSNYPGPAAVQQMPVYYVQNPVQSPVQAQYVPQYQAQPGQVPVGYGQAVVGQGYGGPMRPAFDPYNMGVRAGPDGVGPPVYYGVRNPGLAPGYSGLVGPGGEDMQLQGANVDTKPVRFNQPS